jgi:ABC-type nitrate/sulfonate/bicarbonate transport system substrate-binding protein/outer membrane protein OmpA-like peptidoglycan-associated protein
MDLAHFKTLIGTLVLVCASPLMAKPAYIDSKPLHSVVRTAVGQVQSGTTQVPLITWGADARTLYANGNQAQTRKDSIFNGLGLQLRLLREDSFIRQLNNYISGKSPYLRGTLGMLTMSADLLNKDPRTKPVIIYQLSESAGGDAMVVKKGIRKPADLKGKVIALQAYGPHVDYLTKVLGDAGLTPNDVSIRWLPDLTGSDNTPMSAFYEKDVDAAMVITPDALALTSGGTVGSGAEDSVSGARILMSTKTANRIIADVYAVRSDYFKAHRNDVSAFVRGLMLAQKEVDELVRQRNNRRDEYAGFMRSAARVLLDSEQASSDAEALYHDAKHMTVVDNKRFFTDASNPRRFQKRVAEASSAFISLGLINSKASFSHANWNYGKMSAGLATDSDTRARFDERKLASTIARKQQQGTLDEGEIFSFEVFFKPNQKVFSADLYSQSFDQVIELAATYGGAVITVEGHSDPLGYLKKKKAGAENIILRRIQQSARNLSLTRATEVRNSIIEHAQNRNISLDPSQFAIVGHGIDNPKSGICGNDPCAPKNEKQWRDNMRVKFRIIQLEAESDVFQPL